jgi:hypothetical protein
MLKNEDGQIQSFGGADNLRQHDQLRGSQRISTIASPSITIGALEG